MDMTSAISVANDGDGFPPHDPARVAPASLDDCHSDADTLDYLVARVGGSYTRTRTSDGLVRLRLKTRTGDVLGVIAATTREAVAALIPRVEALR